LNWLNCLPPLLAIYPSIKKQQKTCKETNQSKVITTGGGHQNWLLFLNLKNVFVCCMGMTVAINQQQQQQHRVLKYSAVFYFMK